MAKYIHGQRFTTKSIDRVRGEVISGCGRAINKVFRIYWISCILVYYVLNKFQYVTSSMWQYDVDIISQILLILFANSQYTQPIKKALSHLPIPSDWEATFQRIDDIQHSGHAGLFTLQRAG